MKYCPECGVKIDKEQKFCPNCGQILMQPSSPQRTLVAPSERKTGKLVAGGILIIIGAVLCLLTSIILMFSTYLGSGMISYFAAMLWIFIVALGFWGFAIGLVSGICALKRIKFPIAIIGVSFVIVEGCLAFLFIIGIIILVLAILGIIFIATSKKEFTEN